MANIRSTDEQVAPITANVSGTIPEWLEGSYLTIGPGVFDLDSGFTVNHFFDGYAVLCKFTIRNGKVEFNKRYLQSNSYRIAVQLGKPGVVEFGTKSYPDPNKGIIEAVMSNFLPNITDNCVGRIAKIGNSFFANNSTSILREIHPDDLSTGDRFDLFPLIGVNSWSFNPCDNYGVGASVLASKYYVFKFNGNSETGFKALETIEIVASIPSRWKTAVCLQHTFGSAKDYAVIIDQPYKISLLDAINVRVRGIPFRSSLQWSPQDMTRFYIIEKISGKVYMTHYQTEAFFFINTINTYEENGEIILDVIAHEDPSYEDLLLISNLRKENLPASPNAQAWRFVLPLVENIDDVPANVNLVKNASSCSAIRRDKILHLTHKIIYSEFHELPTLNARYYGRKYRYYYASQSLGNQMSVFKVDVQNGEIMKWHPGQLQIPSQPIFVENIDCTSEDDGVLLVCITSSLPHHDDRLVILDATNMQVIATVSVPCHVPVNIFGLFINK